MTPQKSKQIPDMRHNGAYIARAECGCCFGVSTDCRDKETGRTVAEWIAAGLIITHVSWEEYRNNISKEATFLECPHHKQDEPLPLFAIND